MTKLNWRGIPKSRNTFFRILDNDISKFAREHKHGLPDFSGASTLLLGSDYSGEKSTNKYSVYSFLITTIENWSQWEPKRLSIRQEFFSDKRRMSFKQLGDRQRRRALKPLLEAANSIDGLSFSFAINKKCNSLFSNTIPLDFKNPDFYAYKKWKSNVLQKAFIIIHFFGFLLAGFAKQGQNVIWFTDEDDIAANNERIFELTNLFAWICSGYLSFNLGHCRCGTSRCDDGSRQIEDFLAIPDLIAGALGEQLNLTTDESSKVFWLHRGDFSDKTKTITWWFFETGHPLKRLVYIIDPAEEGDGHKSSFFHFHNQME